jgi:hypothetical protein
MEILINKIPILFKHFSGNFSMNLKKALKDLSFDKPMCALTGRQVCFA